MGLDPATLTTLSPLLRSLADSHSPRILLALRPQDPIPEWITHVVYLGPNSRVQAQGEKNVIFGEAPDRYTNYLESNSTRNPLQSATKSPTQALPSWPVPSYKNQITRRPLEVIVDRDQRESLVEMNGVRVAYGSKTVLGGWRETFKGKEREGLWWQVRRGESWGIFGANG